MLGDVSRKLSCKELGMEEMKVKERLAADRRRRLGRKVDNFLGVCPLRHRTNGTNDVLLTNLRILSARTLIFALLSPPSFLSHTHQHTLKTITHALF